MMYINQKFLNAMDWVMLEIKLPREINKSPLATEMAIASLLQGGGIGNKYAKLFKGGLPAFSSLEIASIEGTIHFYVRIQKKFRPLVESNFYAQYPGIEIVEADDYTKALRYHHLSKDVSMFGVTYRTGSSWTPKDKKNGEEYKHDGKTLTMKADFLPIKTYVDYGLDKDPKEDNKIDPLASVLEIMGSISKGEHFWYQVLIQDESAYNGKKMPKFYVNEATHEHVSLKDMADARKLQIRTSHYLKKGEVVMDEYGYEKQKKKGVDANGNDIYEPLTYNFKDPKAVGKKEMDLSPEEKVEMEAINKKLSKPLAVCIVRFMYVAKKQNFNFAHINDTLSVTKPFAGANSLSPNAVSDPYDFPWQNWGGKRVPWRGEEMFEEYVEREGFYPHIVPRESLDAWEDRFFWPSSMKNRKLFRMIFEAVFHPFAHPTPDAACVLNLEEVATLWHLPGATAQAPGLSRIDSMKGIAPSNLPL